ncbi:hypothetical protein [Arthrobacter methylotrophus]|uniref:Uncharacterized protein n=1 Tax=Arthrobacter methylotrophus TaxID=121291 RepID=A0ABV5UTK3_9MICC
MSEFTMLVPYSWDARAAAGRAVGVSENHHTVVGNHALAGDGTFHVAALGQPRV